jgi:hypothetical protein
LLCLHLIEESLYEGRKPNVNKVKKYIENSSTLGENWLLIYETVVKEWIVFDDTEKVIDNEYFEIMREYDVSFYDIEKQIRPKISIEYDFFQGYHMIKVQYEEEDGEEEWY